MTMTVSATYYHIQDTCSKNWFEELSRIFTLNLADNSKLRKNIFLITILIYSYR